MYSRRLRVEEKENRKKATGFVLLTIAFLAFMLFYGLPILAKISNFAYDLKKSGEIIESSDSTPPPPPRFFDLPASINTDKLEVKGNTEPGAEVTINLNGKSVQVLANNDGDFSQSFSLTEGDNALYSFAKDSSGNKSQDSETHKIILDKKPPDLELSTPKDGDIFYGNKNKQVKVEGKSEKDAQVQINGHMVIVDSSGNFSGTFSLTEGENTITAKSQDSAGNIKEVSIKVKFNP